MVERSQLDKKHVASMLTAFTEVVTEILQEKGSITLIGFGTFSIIERPARKGRNPKTGEEIQIAKVTRAKFKVGKDLDDAIKNGKIKEQSKKVNEDK